MSDIKNFEMDCQDNGCFYAKERLGMRTNGGCRCHTKPNFKFFAQRLFIENEQLKEKQILNWEAIRQIILDEFQKLPLGDMDYLKFANNVATKFINKR